MTRFLRLVATLAALGWPAAAHAADERWDVIVVGGEPEAITAAVAAAEEGARTLLVTEDPRLGGLFVRGAMNVLDLRVTPVDFQLGLFDRWWRAVGRGNAFDVLRGERAFHELLAAAGVVVRTGVGPVAPWLAEGAPRPRVQGVLVDGLRLGAAYVIDGTGDADLAADAGAGWTFGWRPLGLDARMVDTLVFRIDGIDWAALRRGVAQRGRGYAYADERIAYGHFGGHPAAYPPSDPALRLRGLNLGRQDDGSVLVNALLIYGLDPFDPESLADGRARAAAEVDAVVAWLARDVPGFAAARAGGVADALYVRQTRQIETLCTLTVDDVLDHVVTDQDVAAGGYPLDVQTMRRSDDGFVFGLPEVYGARLCMNVPVGVDGLWVVGRAFGADPIAMSSARVVPFGMAVAEAVGVAAALAGRSGRAPADVVGDRSAVTDVRARLTARGAYLPPVAARTPAGPVAHPRYADYRAMLRWGLALGGYDNDPVLDAPVSVSALTYLLANVVQRAYGDADAAARALARAGIDGSPLSTERAAAAFGHFAREVAGADLSMAPTWSDLEALGVGFHAPERPLRRGEVYALGRLLLELDPERGRTVTPPATGAAALR
jgi:hypothetical protein